MERERNDGCKLYEKRTADIQYSKLLELIMSKGENVRAIQGGRALRVEGYIMRFPMENGFPVNTLRDLSGRLFHGALGEHIGFLNGARTLSQLTEYGCPERWWGPWVTKEKCGTFGLETGDLGPGSYGPGWTSFPTHDGTEFNQIEALVEKLKDLNSQKEPVALRTLMVTPWIPQYALGSGKYPRRVVVAPCHGWIHIHLNPEKRTLKVEHYQRSADVPVGLVFNMIQYAAFGMMLGQVINYKFTELIYILSDAHIYEMQFDSVRKLLSREPRKFPKVIMDPDINDIFKFRPNDFQLSEYNPHGRMEIPTPV